MKGRTGDGASESRHATALRGARSRFQRHHHLQLSRSSVNSVYDSSEIDKIRYCQPNRGTGGPTARVMTCPENLHRPGLTTPCGPYLSQAYNEK